MKKNILSFIVLVAVIFSACAQQKKTTKSKVLTAQGTNLTIQSMAMERTPCFGNCPSYRLEIYKDGLVKFKSWSDTEFEGDYEKKFDAVKVSELFRQFEAYRVDTCAEAYESLIQDVPGINYYFTYKDKEQKIMNAHFGPTYMIQMAEETDKQFKVDASWTKTADKKKD